MNMRKLLGLEFDHKTKKRTSSLFFQKLEMLKKYYVDVKLFKKS